MERPDIFMPLYIGDYLAGTSRLTTELHGAYMLLIMDYWMNGAPPDDDQVLASIVKMSPDAWSKARGVLEKFFSISDGCWNHKRIDHELTEATQRKAAAKAKAEKAAAARWPKDKNNAPSNAPSINQGEHKECPSPSPSPSPSEDKKPPSSAKKFTDDDLAIAVEFWQKLFAENPENKKPDFDSWAKKIRLMRERDHRTPVQIRWLWHWARADPFWSSNIRSPEKLRKHWDTLVDKVKKQSEKRHAKPANQPQFDNQSLDWAAGLIDPGDGSGWEPGQPTLQPVAGHLPSVAPGVRERSGGVSGG